MADKVTDIKISKCFICEVLFEEWECWKGYGYRPICKKCGGVK